MNNDPTSWGAVPGAPSSSPESWGAVPGEPPAPRGALGTIDDAVRSLASGVTFGWADKAAAAANAALGQGDYESNVKAEQARTAQIPTAVRLPGEIAGAVGGTVAAAPLTAPIAAATNLARLPAYARAILGGGAAGASFGAGGAKSGEELPGAATGAALGAATGGVVYPAARLAGAAYSGVRNVFSPTAKARYDLARALIRDDATPEQLQAALTEAQRVRPGVATPADVGGENVQGLVERIAQTPGAGRSVVIPALTSRQEQQAARLTDDLGWLTGTRRSALEATKETMATRAEEARPLYEKAFAFDANSAPEIAEAFRREASTGYGRQILNSAEFKNTLQTEYGVADLAQAPLMVLVDAWKKAADDLAGSALRSGNKNSARVISIMRDRVLNIVDEHNPAYAEARNVWAGHSSYLDAIDSGRQITAKSAEEVKSDLAGLSAADREGYVTGALGRIFSKMRNDPAKLADFTKYLRSPEMRDKVAALMPSEEAAKAWRDRLNFEVQSSALTGRALGNSATARRLAEQGDANSLAADLILHSMSGAPPISTLYKVLGFIPTKVRDTLRSRSDNILADILTNPSAATTQDLAQILAAMRHQQAPRSATRAVVPAVAGVEGQ